MPGLASPAVLATKVVARPLPTGKGFYRPFLSVAVPRARNGRDAVAPNGTAGRCPSSRNPRRSFPPGLLSRRRRVSSSPPRLEVMKRARHEETAVPAPSTDRAPAWHCLSTAEVAGQLGTEISAGLTRAEAASRIARYGPNAIQEGEKRSPWRMLLDQFTDFMIIVLLAAAVISGFIGEVVDTIAILVIVLMNGTIGFIQEYRAEKAMAALKKLAAATARVLRDGAVIEVAAAELVPGDVVLLEAGNVVPADLRLFETHGAQDRGGGAHRRVGAGREAHRSGRRDRPRARRSPQHGLQGDDGRLRPRARHRRRHRHADRARQDRRRCSRSRAR